MANNTEDEFFRNLIRTFENDQTLARSEEKWKKSRKKKAKDKKKKKKRKKRTKQDYDVDDDSSEGDKQFPTIQDSQSQKKAEEEFTRRKHEDLSKIPTETSERFLGLGFSKWNKSVLPIIELGPYHVPPGDIRDQWFTMFENVSLFGTICVPFGLFFVDLTDF